jgi:hypothetical protein
MTMTNLESNPESNPELDSFDRALLTELRQVAAERATAPVRRTTRKRWALAGSGIAAAAVTTFGITTLGSSAAYAVDETGDGDVIITIHELDDADGLEEALADHGIEADVDYQSDGGPHIIQGDPAEFPDGVEEGEGGTFEGHAEAELEAGAEVDQAVPGELPANDPCGGFDNMPFTTEMTSDDYVITIPADSVLRESDAVLRITTSGDLEDQVAGLQVAFSVGDVDCGFGTASVGFPSAEG